MSDRGARTILAVLVVVMLVATVRVDLKTASKGSFWGDGATYYSMAWSLAEDFDLRYEVKDLLRVKREFPGGPQGLFLKRACGGFFLDGKAGFPWLGRVACGDEEKRLYFAKPYAYPVAAAPFVRLFGTRGLLLTNALFLALALVLGYGAFLRQTTPGRALVLTIVAFLGTVTPVYLLWPAPELFNLGLVAAGLAAWRGDRSWLSALLLGIAVYSKPYNLWLAIPLGVAPLLGWGVDGEKARAAWATRFAGRFGEASRRGVVLGGTIVLLFGLNAAVTGEANYQGGAERKTFYGKFPLEQDVTFGNSGIWMSTNQLGPRVEGKDATKTSQSDEPPRSRHEIAQSLVWNLAYFWIGRFGGAIPYFAPVALAAVLFLVVGPRGRPGWLALASLVVSWLFYINVIPDNWYGGSGTIGNRYFLNLAPLVLLLVPRGRESLVIVGGLLATVVFTAPILVSPMASSLLPGRHTMSAAFKLLPAELSMLNDLSIFAERWRWKRPFGDTEGDAHKNWPADPKAYYLYFPDDGTFGKETVAQTAMGDAAMGEAASDEGAEGVEGFWIRGGAAAEVILRALEPVREITVKALGGPAGDELTVATGGSNANLACASGMTAQAILKPPAPFVYKDSFVYVLQLRSRRGGFLPARALEAPARRVGAFVRITLEVDRRPRPRAN